VRHAKTGADHSAAEGPAHRKLTVYRREFVATLADFAAAGVGLDPRRIAADDANAETPTPFPKRRPRSPDNTDMGALMNAPTFCPEAPAGPADADPVAPDVLQHVLGSLELLNDLYEYNHWVYTKVRPFLGPAICEIGAGIGNFIQFVLNHDRVVAVEPFERSHRQGSERFSPHGNVSYVQAWLDECPNDDVPAASFDSVVSLKVLEYLEDDRAGLEHLRALCKPGGNVVIFVAAHMSAYGAMDEAYGHRRRYNRRGLAKTFRQAGLDPTTSFYANMPGYFGWWWHSRVRRSRHIPASAARTSNRLIPVIDALERIIQPPFGQSLVMVGTPA